MKKITIIALFCFFSVISFAQRKAETVKPDPEKAKYFSYGLSTNTHSSLIGGLVFRHSTTVQLTEKRKINRYMALELINLKHNKELNLNFLNRVVVGKKNYLFAIRPEYGREWFFFNQVGDEGIGMSGILAVGPSFGLLKPYYIRYNMDNGESPSIVAYDPNTHTDYSKIVGSASIWQGFLTNAKLIPGVHLKTAANFDLNTFGDKVTGIELGFLTEYYFKTPEIMANQITKNSPFFATAYLTLYLGNKIRKK